MVTALDHRVLRGRGSQGLQAQSLPHPLPPQRGIVASSPVRAAFSLHPCSAHPGQRTGRVRSSLRHVRKCTPWVPHRPRRSGAPRRSLGSLFVTSPLGLLRHSLVWGSLLVCSPVRPFLSCTTPLAALCQRVINTRFCLPAQSSPPCGLGSVQSHVRLLLCLYLLHQPLQIIHLGGDTRRLSRVSIVQPTGGPR